MKPLFPSLQFLHPFVDLFCKKITFQDMKKILIIVPDGGMLFESAGIADILMQANRLHPEASDNSTASGYPWSVRFKSAGRPSSA